MTDATQSATQDTTRRALPRRVIEVPERLPEARNPLDPRAKTLWRINGVIGALVMLLVFSVPAFGARLLFADYSILWPIAGAALIVLFGAIDVWFLTNLRYRWWRYEIRADEADLQHGWLTRTRQLIPMSRIQHVDTSRGPLERRLGLASVMLSTASGTATIPALADDVAADVRDRIATLANVRDDL